MTTPIKTDLDLNQNQLIQPVAHKSTAAPSSPVAGQFAFFDSTLKFYDGTKWVDTGLMLATDAQATAGTAENVAVNPKQLAAKANIASPTFTGTPSAPTAAVGTSTTQLATTAFVAAAIAAEVLNAKIYKGTWDTTNQSDFSGLNSYRPIKAGWNFDVIGTGCTIGGVEYKAGDSITFRENVAAGTTITGDMIHKTDNTESDDLVRLDTIQTLTNKTINGNSNTLSNLTMSMFKSGEVVTTMGNVNKLVTAAAVYAALADYQTSLTFSTGLTNTSGTVTVDHPFIALAENSLVRGGDGGTLVEISAGTNGHVLTSVNGVPTWQAPVSQIKKRTYSNPALTPSSGVCTWNITHDLNTKDYTVRIYEVSTGEDVIMDRTATGDTALTIQFNSASNVAAGTYKVVIVG
jgi:hypothetical protein